MAAIDPSREKGRQATLLIGVGLAFQAVQTGVFFVVWVLWAPHASAWSFALYPGVLGILWFGLVYALAYLPARAGELERARTPTLVFAVLSVVTIGLVSGLFYALAHHELEPVRAPLAPAASPSSRPLVSSSRTCPGCRTSNPQGGSFCRTCGLLLP